MRLFRKNTPINFFSLLVELVHLVKKGSTFNCMSELKLTILVCNVNFRFMCNTDFKV